jgi:hypothetical protein
MRRYLLLGQGDFIRHLMDLLESVFISDFSVFIYSDAPNCFLNMKFAHPVCKLLLRILECLNQSDFDECGHMMCGIKTMP